MTTIDRTDDEGGSGDGEREMEVKNSSSKSVAEMRKGFSSEGSSGSVFERLSADLGTLIRALGRSSPPHVSCRRRGFGEERDETLRTTNKID